MKKKLFLLAIPIILLTGTFLFIFTDTNADYPPITDSVDLDGDPKASDYDDDVIHIDGDSEFESMADSKGWAGNGTEDNPYIIEDYRINSSADGDPSTPIWIQNVNLYFQIRNVSAIQGDYRNGFQLSDTDNVMIYNNTIKTCGSGIDLVHSSYAVIDNNTIINNGEEGIYIENCNNIDITNNIVNDNAEEGVFFWYSNDCEAINNTFDNNEYGIQVSTDKEENLVFKNNTATNGKIGFYIGSDAANNQIVDNTARDNDQSGFDIFSGYNNISGNIATGNSIGFGLDKDTDQSVNNTFTDNIADNNDYYGFKIWYDNNDNNFTENTANDNAQYGIYLRDCKDNLVKRNMFSGNGDGCVYEETEGDNIVLDNYCDDPDVTVPHPFLIEEYSYIYPDIMLNWTSSDYADNYTVYRNDTAIGEGIESTNYTYTDVNTTGTSEFHVKAINDNGDTESNTIEATALKIKPMPFNLSSNAGDPDEDGCFTLNWTVSDYADNYTVYQNDTVLIAGLTVTEWNVIDLSNGNYTFYVKSINAFGENVSNEIDVQVEHEECPECPEAEEEECPECEECPEWYELIDWQYFSLLLVFIPILLLSGIAYILIKEANV